MSKLHFQNLYFLRTPTFSEQIHFFSKPTFSEDVVFLNSYFSTANLAFIVTLSIDYLVINPTNTRVFRLKLPRGCTKCWTIQKFSIKFAFSGQHWTELSIGQCKKFQFLECLIKISISVLNFSNESAKEPIIHDVLFLIAIHSSKNDNKHHSEMRN